jgi:hypothetical protein
LIDPDQSANRVRTAYQGGRAVGLRRALKAPVQFSVPDPICQLMGLVRPKSSDYSNL